MKLRLIAFAIIASAALIAFLLVAYDWSHVDAIATSKQIQSSNENIPTKASQNLKKGITATSSIEPSSSNGLGLDSEVQSGHKQDQQALSHAQGSACGENPYATLCDTDEDGISDGDEASQASDPYNRCDPDNSHPSCDQDFDGVSDSAELAQGSGLGDPCDPDPGAETCLDQFIEYPQSDMTPSAEDLRADATFAAQNKDISEASRQETLRDPCELNRFVSECDSDGDGISDGLEQNAGTDLTDPCSPEPYHSACDSDNDGVSDGAERASGSDALDGCDPDPDQEFCFAKGDPPLQD